MLNRMMWGEYLELEGIVDRPSIIMQSKTREAKFFFPANVQSDASVSGAGKDWRKKTRRAGKEISPRPPHRRVNFVLPQGLHDGLGAFGHHRHHLAEVRFVRQGKI